MNYNQLEKELKNYSELWKRKNKDYGDTCQKMYDKHGMDYFDIMFEQKLNRIQSLLANKESNNESLLDSVIDLGGYAFICAAILRAEHTEDTMNQLGDRLKGIFATAVVQQLDPHVVEISRSALCQLRGFEESMKRVRDVCTDPQQNIKVFDIHGNIKTDLVAIKHEDGSITIEKGNIPTEWKSSVDINKERAKCSVKQRTHDGYEITKMMDGSIDLSRPADEGQGRQNP